MTIAAGTRVGRYEIRSKIGEGGMGEVYLARDTQLGRDVAVKVLPSSYSDDKERLRRFEQEACAASALNHPNILSIYDVGIHDGSSYVVSELLQGQTLRQRISGTALPQRKAIDFALQISHGLAAAHEKGIVHRDLKPDNLFITNDGRVKILDFGLAKLTGAGNTELSQTGIPTRRVDTDPGKVMGTVGYMSPEQVKGRAVDHRSDIFSFGTILYEMLSGRRAFHGESAAETMSAILREDPPDLSGTKQRISPALERLVNRCLEKNAESRFHSASDLAFALETLSGSAPTSTETIGISAGPPRWIKRRELLIPWGIAAIAIIVAIALALLYFRRPVAPAAPVTRYYISPPEKANFVGGGHVISPDGRQLVTRVSDANGKEQLWIQSLDSVTPQRLPGTEAAGGPFWSPDSRAIGFFVGGKLKRMDVSGGPAQTLADAPNSAGGSWNSDGVILLGSTLGIQRVSATGGDVVPVTTLDASLHQMSHTWPWFLPDGRHFLYLARSSQRENTGIYLGSLDSKESRLLVKGDSGPAYASRYLLYGRESSLMAQPFDPDKLQLTGDAFPIAGQMGWNTVNGRAFFSVSGNGTLIYRTGGARQTQVTWFDRTGKQISQLGTVALNASVRLSPDDKHVVVTRWDNQIGTSDLWLVDEARETRFTFDPQSDSSPVWSPDGGRIAFNSNRLGVADVYAKPSSVAGIEELLVQSNNPKGPHDWSADGQYILYGELGPATAADIWVLPLFGERKPFPFLQTSFVENSGRFSPDGHWVAYTSNETGVDQIYVRPFPPAEGQFMVSTNGGSQPRWRADGKELFYLSPDQKIMAVDIKEDAIKFEPGTPKLLFEARIFIPPGNPTSYEVSRNGQRFLMNTPVEQSSASPLTVVLNWPAILDK